LEHCHKVDLLSGDILCEPELPYRYVYFPLTSFISLMAAVDHQHPLEMGGIGNEGMLGITLILGVDAALLRGVVKGAGSALRMSVEQLERDISDFPALLFTLNKYLYLSMVQASQASICNYFHKIQPRLARWLLMTHDRVQQDNFTITHEYLAVILGVRRSSITVAAGSLQRKRLIEYSRGEIHILNRKGLEAVSCDCYSAMNEEYGRLLEPV
jgi:hypothetical protein